MHARRPRGWLLVGDGRCRRERGRQVPRGDPRQACQMAGAGAFQGAKAPAHSRGQDDAQARGRQGARDEEALRGDRDAGPGQPHAIRGAGGDLRPRRGGHRHARHAAAHGEGAARRQAAEDCLQLEQSQGGAGGGSRRKRQHRRALVVPCIHARAGHRAGQPYGRQGHERGHRDVLLAGRGVLHRSGGLRPRRRDWSRPRAAGMRLMDLARPVPSGGRPAGS
mmetsp:Transcript_854/g.2660  ORF Transcript_854/g.2660 Transcript_854/m.2660 type:complete len:222 (+) Transcript_854:933-1598(+)